MAESIQELMERILEENDYTNLHLPETDLLGETMQIFLNYDGDLWHVYLGVSGSDVGHFCWVEDGELKRDNTFWSDYETPEEALQALDQQCKEMKSRKVILVSYDQLSGEGYAYDPAFADDKIEME